MKVYYRASLTTLSPSPTCGTSCHLQLSVLSAKCSNQNIRIGRKAAPVPILKNINGRFKAGHLTAILGPSGSGKTTLLNVLSGFRTSGITGSILINGEKRSKLQFRKLSCYIAQEFHMLPLLTTYEILMTAADLKLGTTVKNVKKTAMINAILDTMGLKKTKNTLVKNLSGGEKKRLSIACELLTNPPVMFFDEPTSGLDSVSSMQVISHLKSLAQSGRTVVCSIHQPSSQLFELFDDLYLLAEGECAYSGPIDEMMTVFEDAGFTCSVYYNRADFVDIDFAIVDCHLSIVNRTKASGFATLLYSSVKDTKETILTLTEEKSLESNELYPSSSWLQFIILTKRSILCSLRDMYSTPHSEFNPGYGMDDDDDDDDDDDGEMSSRSNTESYPAILLHFEGKTSEKP
ncbi:hypothetical protein ANN_22164 [Periplaneta americana]|uniref:ABC transporter domain-containing protein n=1 Tax=Periplaneta americana TaxID=6978 RepID=A0ABQ8S894_PERAM|nr:hypothetical protein ANN_22164 [Periplaneta americana]